MHHFQELMFGDWLRLRFIVRYARYPRIKDESVAEHSFFVCLFATTIATWIEAEHGSVVEWRRLMQKCVYHDADEAHTGDIDGPFKHTSPRLHYSLATVAEQYLQTMLKRTGLWSALLVKNISDNSMSCLEHSILKLADDMSVVQYCYSEIELGNRGSLSRKVDIREQLQLHKEDSHRLVIPYYTMLLDVANRMDQQNRGKDQIV
jgi:5'-deoxynucleotidase